MRHAPSFGVFYWLGVGLVAAFFLLAAPLWANDFLANCELKGRTQAEFMLEQGVACLLSRRDVNVTLFTTQDGMTGEPVVVFGYDLRQDRPQQINSSQMHRDQWRYLLREVMPEVLRRQQLGEKFVLVEQFEGSWPIDQFDRDTRIMLGGTPQVAFFKLRFVPRDPLFAEIAMTLTLDASSGRSLYVAGLEPPTPPSDWIARLRGMFGGG